MSRTQALIIGVLAALAFDRCLAFSAARTAALAERWACAVRLDPDDPAAAWPRATRARCAELLGPHTQ